MPGPRGDSLFDISANLELLFAEADDRRGEAVANVGDRIRAAADLGLRAAEIWGWRTKDIRQLSSALRATGVTLHTMCVDPMGTLVDPATHELLRSAVKESATVAEELGCSYLVITGGDRQEGISRGRQHRAVVDGLRGASRVLDGAEVTLLLENLNSQVDHVGTFLDSTAECLDIVEEVDSPRVRFLYDEYHSLMMDERPEIVLRGRVDLVSHVQIADIPGRGEPGSGNIDWSRELLILKEIGYTGHIGLECRPTIPTRQALQHIMNLLGGGSSDGQEPDDGRSGSP